ncbi:MAG: lactate utilization protein [Ancalomicrobiaceae bacterium]|nr:lactate utilization protein [Ancalomicrobiaceae bacterium]
MTAKGAIFAGIRRSLGTSGADIARRADVSDRLQRPPKGLIPARGQLDRAGRVELFVAEAKTVSTTVERVATAADVPAAIADYLRSKNLPQAIRSGADPRLASLPWDTEPQLTVTQGPSKGDDLAGLSHAFAGVAETGTLVLTSGPDNPTTLAFLPEFHLVVIEAADIAGDYEAVWDRLRATYGKGEMPRNLNFITGPSRSGDIEQTILLGAHGPKSLHVIVVEAETP